MIAEIIDIIESLALIMEEETESLTVHHRRPGQAMLVDAKLRLVAALEIRVAQIGRRSDDWPEALAAAERDLLLAALARLRAAVSPNARALERQIDLSREMMGVVAAEAQRLSGNRSATYGARGALAQADLPTPISVNTSL